MTKNFNYIFFYFKNIFSNSREEINYQKQLPEILNERKYNSSFNILSILVFIFAIIFSQIGFAQDLKDIDDEIEEDDIIYTEDGINEASSLYTGKYLDFPKDSHSESIQIDQGVFRKDKQGNIYSIVRDTNNGKWEPHVYISSKNAAGDVSYDSPVHTQIYLNQNNPTSNEASAYFWGLWSRPPSGNDKKNAKHIHSNGATLVKKIEDLVSRRTQTSSNTQPSSGPSSSPTRAPTTQPSSGSSSSPTRAPTTQPSSEPSSSPTRAPTTQPSSGPSSSPTRAPTTQPSSGPSSLPTAESSADAQMSESQASRKKLLRLEHRRTGIANRLKLKSGKNTKSSEEWLDESQESEEE